jgi:two-component system, LuxR family, response regulator FixJ
MQGVKKDQDGAVVVVDDDPAVLDSLKFLLELFGRKVVTYASAAAFLEDSERAPSCVILDHHMPNMTGLELAAQLRARHLRLPVLLITGSPSLAITRRAAQLDIKVLEKPPDERDLLDFVEEHSSSA